MDLIEQRFSDDHLRTIPRKYEDSLRIFIHRCRQIPFQGLSSDLVFKTCSTVQTKENPNSFYTGKDKIMDDGRRWARGQVQEALREVVLLAARRRQSGGWNVLDPVSEASSTVLADYRNPFPTKISDIRPY